MTFSVMGPDVTKPDSSRLDVLIWCSWWRDDEISPETQQQRLELFQFWLFPHRIAQSAAQKLPVFGGHRPRSLASERYRWPNIRISLKMATLPLKA